MPDIDVIESVSKLEIKQNEKLLVRVNTDGLPRRIVDDKIQYIKISLKKHGIDALVFDSRVTFELLDTTNIKI